MTAAISVAMTGGTIWGRNLETKANMRRFPSTGFGCPM
jgi:hypothetical protein